MIGSDPERVKGYEFNGSVARRAWGFARPYRWPILGFLVTIAFDAVIGLAPPLLFRAILDTAIPEGDRTLVVVLASITVLVALVDAGLGIVQRWYQARVGEGLIFQLRTALFDKVQRMPIAFFTRTQTGALMSRMNNDVIGAQGAVTHGGLGPQQRHHARDDAHRDARGSSGGSPCSRSSCCRSSSSRRSGSAAPCSGSRASRWGSTPR